MQIFCMRKGKNHGMILTGEKPNNVCSMAFYQREIVSRQYLRDYSAKIWEGRVFITCLGVTLSEQRLNSATPAKKLGSKRGKEHGMEITRE